jgi:hypothetical protein
MTSQGLKTFRLSGNKPATVEASKSEASADSILKIQQPLPIQIPTTNSSLLRAKLPADFVRSLPVQQQQQQPPTSAQSSLVQSVLKVSSKSLKVV